MPKYWKRPRHPSKTKWIKCIHTIEYYSSIKRYELSSYKKTWGKLKCIWLSERSEYGKATHHMVLTISNSGKGKTIVTAKRSVFANLME